MQVNTLPLNLGKSEDMKAFYNGDGMDSHVWEKHGGSWENAEGGHGKNAMDGKNEEDHGKNAMDGKNVDGK